MMPSLLPFETDTAASSSEVLDRSEHIPLAAESDVVKARQAVRRAATELALNIVVQTKLITAASELGRNTLIHGGGGYLLLEIIRDVSRRAVRLTFIDQGPGIPDIELAMRDGFTTGSGLGLGLGGSRRLVSDFKIASKEGQGTRITLTQWNR